MTLTSLQQVLFKHLKATHNDHSSSFTVSVERLRSYLTDKGFDVSEKDVIENIQDLYRLDTGLRVLSTSLQKNNWMMVLRWVLSPSERTRLWREEQKRLGRSVRTFYLTDEESEKVSSFIDMLREEKCHSL